MPSEVNICNIALLKVGAKPKIDSLIEDSDNARHCNQFYPMVRDAVLRGHPWNCAIHRRTITALAATPDSDWDYQFQLPVNPYCLRVLQVGAVIDQPIEWVVEGRRLLCNESRVPIKYIKRITDTNEFDSLLVDAISVALAIKLAMPLAQDPKLQDSLIKEFELIVLPLARSIDAQESSTQTLKTEGWLNSRY